MISLLVRLLRPLFLPLLKLRLEPPHLPEGSTLVRELKPEPQWLTLKYLAVLAGSLGLVGAVGTSIGALVALGKHGILPAVLAGVFLLGSVGLGLVVARLDYELRHYLVGDKSLRVSQGAWVRREVTLSYANVQNIEVTAGPLETLLGIKTLTLSTAGGNSGPGDSNPHHAKLEGLKNADEIKQLILGMLKGHRDAGLGDLTEAVRSDGLDPVALEEVRLAALNLRNVAESLAVYVDFPQPAKN